MTLIVSDTTSGLPLDLAEKMGIAMLPQIVIFGDQSFRDDHEISSAEFLTRLRTSSTLPKTAAPPPALYHPIFQQALEQGESVIIIAPSAKVSGTVRSAETAREEFPQADVRIIDTQTIAACQGTLVLIAHELVQQGRSPDEIVAEINRLIPRCRTYFVVDTLEFLQKGGRIGAARALLGELLQVKPILQIKDGQVCSLAQERTKKRAIARLIDLVGEQVNGHPDVYMTVMHIDAEPEAEAIRGELALCLGLEDIPIYLLPPAIVTHAGPKALAVGFIIGE